MTTQPQGPRKTPRAARRHAGVPIGLVAIAGAALAACGSSPSSSPTTVKPSSSTPTTTHSTTSTTAAKKSSSTSSKLTQFAGDVAKESKATFKLTYKTFGTTPVTLTLEQLPPDQAFIETSSDSTFEMLYNGSKTYYCTLLSTGSVCEQYTSKSATPLSDLIDIYSGADELSAIRSWETYVTSGINGYKVSFSTATFGGQSSQCVTWSYQTTTVKYCVTKSGVLAYDAAGTGGKALEPVFELIGYSTSVPAPDFALPKGATVTTAS